MSGFKVGDRIRIKAESVAGFVQPWRSRFEKGCEGRITGLIPGAKYAPFLVTFDSKRKPKRPSDWVLNVHERDMELVERAQ